MGQITIGVAASDRATTASGNKTRFNLGNPANASGKITTVEIWTNSQMAGCKVATFYLVSGTHYSTRDYETVNNGNGDGVVLAGSKQIFTVDLDVEEGDFIGYTCTSGSIKADTSGDGTMYTDGDVIPADDVAFYSSSALAISIYGEGSTEEENFVYAGTGSFTYSGSATVIFGLTSVGSGTYNFSGIGLYVFGLSYVGSGGLTYSGTATAYVDTRHYLYTASGDFGFSGTGSYSLGFASTGTGTFTYSGPATQSYTRNYSCVGSGSFKFGGTAVYGEGGWFYSGWFEYGWFYGVGVTTDFIYTGTGSFAYSGTAVKSYTFNYSCIASGSLEFSGIGTYSIDFSRVGSGTLAFSGAGVYSFGVSYTGSGNFIYLGDAECSYDIEIPPIGFIYAATGKFKYSGISVQTYTFNYLYSGSGEFIYFSGSAGVEKFNFIFTGSGTVIFSGGADWRYCYSYTKVDKETSIYTKTDKGTSDYTKVDKKISITPK